MKGAVGKKPASTTLIALILIVYSLFCVLPMVLVFMVSITDESAIMKNGYSLVPERISFKSYEMVFLGDPLMLKSMGISVFITVFGTLLAVAITAMAAYPLANKGFRHSNAFALFFFITMIFHTGLVPWYLMCTNLHLRNNILALIIPRLVFSPFNLFLCRNYMKTIHDSLMDSALMDGCNHGQIFLRIYAPLCKPILATIALFYGVGYWNDWFNAIMLVDNEQLYPLQFLLFRLRSYMAMLTQLQHGIDLIEERPPAESFKMATTIITIGPILLFYPFLQRYIVKGLVIGSVKG